MYRLIARHHNGRDEYVTVFVAGQRRDAMFYNRHDAAEAANMVNMLCDVAGCDVYDDEHETT